MNEHQAPQPPARTPLDLPGDTVLSPGIETPTAPRPVLPDDVIPAEPGSETSADDPGKTAPITIDDIDRLEGQHFPRTAPSLSLQPPLQSSASLLGSPHSSIPLATDDRADWRTYWEQLGQFWRREPRITPDRQRELQQRRNVPSAERWWISPFSGLTITRADIEWLLANHDWDGRTGPVNPHDPSQQFRQGLNLIGLDLSGVDLSDLPLAHMRGSLSYDEARRLLAMEQRGSGAPNAAPSDDEIAALRERLSVKLSDANLQGTDLAGAYLSGVSLAGANLYGAYLPYAVLTGANLAGANLQRVIFNAQTDLYHAILGDKKRGGAALADVQWNGADITQIDWRRIDRLGDERVTHDAVLTTRAYQQMTALLDRNGFHQDARRLAYRARVTERAQLRQSGNLLHYAGSLVMDVLTGYGTMPERVIGAYIIIIAIFTAIYSFVTALTPGESLLLSITAFHGRGFIEFSVYNLGSALILGESILGVFLTVMVIIAFARQRK